ncbi:MAG: hypothetical protein DDT28_00846 [Dehalococcoidia bacterium]|nr:hypothetical protein [Chloroflexota bacterium]
MHVTGQEPQDCFGKRGLTTARLPDDHHRRFPADLETHPIHRLKRAPRGAEVEAQILDLDKGISLHHISLNRGLTMRSRLKPTMAKPSPINIRTNAGASTQW